MKLISIHLFLRGLTLTLLGIFAIGCSSSPDVFEEPAEVKSQDKAGSTHIAVLSVARWDRYHEALQPAFKLTSEDALNLALPDTLALEEKFLDALGVSAKVAAGGTSVTETTTLHEETGKDPSLTRDVTEKTEPGDPSKINFGASPAGARTAAALPGGALSAALRADPMLRYWTATALYQEVQLLNRYVKDAAINEQYEPYLVRLQISVMPQMRNEPYDAYAAVSFFHGDFPTDEGPTTKQFIEAFTGENTPTSLSEVKIVPLLVTDNIEAMVRSRSVDRIRQLAVGLAAMFKGIGAAGELQKLDEVLRSALGRDYNSTLTVARMSENTLRVRFGAMHQAGVRYAMLPQTHNVTLLVLVPRVAARSEELAQRIIRVVSKTTMVHAVNGTALPARTQRAYDREVRKIFEKRGLTAPDREQMWKLVGAVAANDLIKFEAHLKSVFGDERIHYRDTLWLDLVSLRLGSEWGSATFVVPQMSMGRIEGGGNPTQALTLIDDGRSAITTIIRDTSNIEPARTRVVLHVKAKRLSEKNEPVDPEEAIELPASAIVPGERGLLSATFPSLAALRMQPTEKPILRATVTSPGANSTTYEFRQVAYVVRPQAPKAPFEITTRAKVINADATGTGRVQLLIENPKNVEVTAKIEGGDVLQMSGEPAGILAKDRLVGSGVVTLELFNLNPISNVVITAKAKDSEAAPPAIVLPVIQLPCCDKPPAPATAPIR